MKNKEIIVMTKLNYFFMYYIEYQRTNGGISGKDEGAGGTGQGDSHAASEFSLISYSSPSYTFVTFIARHVICTQANSSVPAKQLEEYKIFSLLYRNLIVLIMKIYRYMLNDTKQ